MYPYIVPLSLFMLFRKTTKYKRLLDLPFFPLQDSPLNYQYQMVKSGQISSLIGS